MSRTSDHQGSTVAEDILGHKLGDSTSRAEVMKILEEVVADREEIRSAQKKLTNRNRALWAMFIGTILAFAACVAASVLAVKVTRDTKHKHKSNTQSGTQSLLDVNGDAITTSLTTFEASGDEAMCALLHPPTENVDARALGSVTELTISYQGETAQKLLHLRVGSIEYGVPDDPEDGEATICEITSVSGRDSLVLQQSGAVFVSKDDKLFATELVCDVERRRELFVTVIAASLIITTGLSLHDIWS